MNSIVIELQRDALDENVSLGALLRKARLIAQKLDVPELVTWCELELHGYKEGTSIPAYRHVNGNVECWNPFNGRMCPIVWKGTPPERLMSRSIGQSVAELLDLKNRNGGKDILAIPFSNDVSYRLMQQIDTPTPPVLVVDRSQLVGILDKVRSLVLDWAAKLEKNGILGEGMTFTEEEKHKSIQNQNIHIGSFLSISGNVTQSTISQNVQLCIKKNDFESLSAFLKSAGVPEVELNELKEAIGEDADTATVKGFGKSVASWIGKMSGKAADGSWQIALGAAGSLLADALKAFYGH